MKRLLIYLLTAFISLCLLTACDKKQHAIDNLRDFVENVEKKAPEYTEKDWIEADKKYDELIIEIEKYRYSGEESKQIGVLKGRYSGIKTKNKVTKFLEDIDNATQEFKGVLEGFTEGILGSDEKSE